MTSSGKVRIYELSKDLGLENKDVLDAAEKLSIVAGDSGCAEIPETVDRPVTLPMLPWLGVGEWWWWWWPPPRRGEP